MALSQMDETLALSVIRERKTERRRRCSNCQLMFPGSELHPDYDDEDRHVGWVCDSCY